MTLCIYVESTIKWVLQTHPVKNNLAMTFVFFYLPGVFFVYFVCIFLCRNVQLYGTLPQTNTYN